MNPVSALLLCLTALPALAQDLPDPLVRAELIDGWMTDRGTQVAAIRLTMPQGWHTYWRSPGEGGIPPVFDWAGSRNLAGVAFHWPVPQVFDLGGLRTLGYEDELVLPVELSPETPGEPLTVSARIDLGVCDEVCVPATVTVAGALNGTGPRDPRIERALSDQPLPGGQAGVTAARCSAEPISDGLRLTAEVSAPAVGPGEFGVIELADRRVWVSQASGTRDGNALTLVSDLVPPEARPFALDRSGIRITLFGGGRAVDIRGCAG
jgi:DsbC/DsbD-like thiol-disulfide interchange protein